VQACRRVGIKEPEDVRWCRLRDYLNQTSGWMGLFHPHSWRHILSGSGADDKGCSCGCRLPTLDRVTFTFTTGHEVTYLLGQCPRCRSIFWDEA
jgi:hypothetical protein